MFLAIAQYCAIEKTCYCTILNIIILVPDLDQLDNWANNHVSKYILRVCISKHLTGSFFVKTKLSLILGPLDLNVDQFENGTKN